MRLAVSALLLQGAAGFASNSKPEDAPIAPTPSLEERCKQLGTEDGPVPGDQCTMEWELAQPHMRPTQPGIGYAYAMRKLLHDMDAYKTMAEAQKAATEEMGNKGIPTVKYGADYFFTDGHHTQSALDALHGVHPGIKVNITITIICDMSDLSTTEFWDTMASRGWAYLWNRPPNQPNALPTKFDPSLLPKTVSWRSPETATLSNDIWRSFAGFSRKVEDDYITKWWPHGVSCDDESKLAFDPNTEYKYVYTCDADTLGREASDDKCMRAFDRHCDADTCTTIPFFEYYWGYFMNDMYNKKDPLASTFAQIYEKPLVAISDAAPYYTQPTDKTVEAANLPDLLPWTFCNSADGGIAPDVENAKCKAGKDGYKQWIDVTAELIPLARVGGAGSYVLPDGFLKQNTLPGVVPGYLPIYYGDADCITAAASC